MVRARPMRNLSLFQRRFFRPLYWSSWPGYGAIRLLALLPMPVIALLGVALGEIAYLLVHSRRHIATRNIDACFSSEPEAARRHMVHRHFRLLGQASLATAIGWFAGRARMRRIVRLRGREYLDQARAEGRNIILLAPHFMSVEICGIGLAAHGYKLIDIYRRYRNEMFDLIAYKQRIRFGGVAIEMYQEGMKATLREIKAGGILYYLPDQDSGPRNAVFAPFFGVSAATISVMGRLAKITDAVVIPCVPRMRTWGRGFELEILPPLENYPVGDDLADAMRMNQVIEEMVRQMPAQYFWVHGRFKTRPPGEPNFYK